MPVAIEKPRSFEIEKFLLAYSLAQKNNLSLIDPDTGTEIFHTLSNLPMIGLTFQPTPSKSPFGFLAMAGDTIEEDQNSDDPKGTKFEPEALLVLDVDPDNLPTDVEEAWVIQVKNQENEAAYYEIAKALSDRFGDILVIISSAHKKNTDATIDEGAPVNPKRKKGEVWCPIVIRTTEKLKNKKG